MGALNWDTESYRVNHLIVLSSEVVIKTKLVTASYTRIPKQFFKLLSHSINLFIGARKLRRREFRCAKYRHGKFRSGKFHWKENFVVLKFRRMPYMLLNCYQLSAYSNFQLM